MTHAKIEKSNINIYQFPPTEVTNATQLTLGDLHANAMFMMHFLVTNGVVKISEEIYRKLTNIYCKSDVTKTDIQQFNQIIDELEISEKPLIRFIGDEICDRGQNDYFIFKILDKLKKSDVKTEIILSNHGIEFLIPYENKRELYAPNIGFMGQSKSMDNMRNLIKKGVITTEEVDALITESYLPNLKLISYSLHKNNITIYSHAGIGLETIQALAKKFKKHSIVYKDKTTKDLAQTIEAINEVFSKHVQAGTAHTLAVDITNPYDFKNDPVTFLIWNRSYGKLKRKQKNKDNPMYFAHGHDSHEPTQNNIFNLDNISFKGASDHVGSYTVL
ncbi:Dot/Icm T4SS effector Wip, partial [Legionella sp.]|uniref:Dot/Icm T4SS effector Wip n=1 Tax=Legionella sp. TaxID=459 RepID=UPI003C84A307